MKYILVNDLYAIFKNKIKYVLGYVILLILCLCMYLIFGYPLDDNLFFDVMGLDFNLIGDPLSIVLFLLHIIISIYISVFLFTKDIINGIDNIFLRIKPGKWILYKLLSIIFIFLVIKVCIYVLVVIIFTKFFHMDFDMLKLFYIICTDIIYFSVIQCISIFLYITYEKKIFVLPIILIIFMLLFNNISFNIISLQKYAILMLLILIIIILYICKIMKYLYVKVFENS